MIKVLLIRDYQQFQTPGKLLIYEHLEFLYICNTLELPWLSNIKCISCISAGTYQVNKVDEGKRGKHFRLLSVPGRSGILIHSGNFASSLHPDTFGCILPGRSFTDINKDGKQDIADSKKVLSELWKLLPYDFLLTIL